MKIATDTVERIASALQGQRWMDGQQLVASTGLARTKALKAVRVLVDQGVVVRRLSLTDARRTRYSWRGPVLGMASTQPVAVAVA